MKKLAVVGILLAVALSMVAIVIAVQPAPEARGSGAPLYYGSFVANDANSYVRLWNGADLTMYSDEGSTAVLTIDGATGSLNPKVSVTLVTTNTTATAAKSGSTYYVTATATIALPSAAAGLNYCVYNQSGDDIAVDPATGDQILVLTNAAGDKLTNTTAGDSICVQAYDATYWLALERVGTWTDGD